MKQIQLLRPTFGSSVPSGCRWPRPFGIFGLDNFYASRWSRLTCPTDPEGSNGSSNQRNLGMHHMFVFLCSFGLTLVFDGIWVLAAPDLGFWSILIRFDPFSIPWSADSPWALARALQPVEGPSKQCAMKDERSEAMWSLSATCQPAAFTTRTNIRPLLVWLQSLVRGWLGRGTGTLKALCTSSIRSFSAGAKCSNWSSTILHKTSFLKHMMASWRSCESTTTCFFHSLCSYSVYMCIHQVLCIYFEWLFSSLQHSDLTWGRHTV